MHFRNCEAEAAKCMDEMDLDKVKIFIALIISVMSYTLGWESKLCRVCFEMENKLS